MITSSVLPHYFDKKIYIGPPSGEKRGRREKLALRENETPALGDVVSGYAARSLKVSPHMYDQYVSTPLRGKLYAEEITHHVTQRVALFFQQLVVGYKTGLHFELGETTLQAGQATHLTVCSGQQRCQIKRAAAHSSTLPALVAYHGEEWKAYKKEGSPKPQGFAFLRRSDLDRNANATVELPLEVNQADSALDGSNTHPKLRKEALDLLNRAAQGKITPQEGLKAFLENLLERIDTSLCSSPQVQEIYRETVEDIDTRVETDATLWEHLLGIHISDQRASWVKEVYKIRFKAIQEAQQASSLLMECITAVQKEVLQQVNRTPTHFSLAFKAVLLTRLNKEDRRCIQQLLNFPFGLRVKQGPDGKNIPYLEGESLKGWEKTVAKLRPYLPKIQELAGKLATELSRLRTQEIAKRGQIFHHLRLAQNWSYRSFSRALQEQAPHLPTSTRTLGRIESQQRMVDKPYAEEIAAVLKVDPGLLVPAFFWSLPD